MATLAALLVFPALPASAHVPSDELRTVLDEGEFLTEELGAIHGAVRDLVVEIQRSRAASEPAPEPAADAEEEPAKPSRHADLSWAYLDDGSCGVPGNTVQLQFDHESHDKDLIVRGEVRTNPSGGDCEVDALSYGISVEQDLPFDISGFEVSLKLVADHRSAAAQYVLLDNDGAVLTRGDGGPLYAPILPAGAADTVVGAVLGCREFQSGWDLCAGINVVPVDWVDAEDGRTVHFGARYEREIGDSGEFDLVLNADVGEGAFGDLTGTYRHEIGRIPGDLLDGNVELVAQAQYAFGVDEVANGAPTYQTVNGARFLAAGPPESRSMYFKLGLSAEF